MRERYLSFSEFDAALVNSTMLSRYSASFGESLNACESLNAMDRVSLRFPCITSMMKFGDESPSFVER